MAQSSVGPSYFYEDEVYRVGKSGDVEFGMVTENWEMYSSSDEEEHGDKVLPGQVCVSWYPKGKEEVLPESKVKLSARSLMPGDVVRRLIAGKDTQRGYCRSVKVRAAVQVVGTKKVIPNVVASDLVPVQKLTSEVAVYLDTWIGVIRDMKYRLHLKFADNSTCEVDSSLIMEHFEDVRRGFDSFSASDVFYPGQKLRGPMRFLKVADWSYCSDDMKRAKDRKFVTVVVTDVVPSSMTVQWQWQTPECPLETPPENVEWQKNPPPETVKGDTLKRVKALNLFESCTVQLGDVSYYTPKSADVIVEKVAWRKTLPSHCSQQSGGNDNPAFSGTNPGDTKTAKSAQDKNQAKKNSSCEGGDANLRGEESNKTESMEVASEAEEKNNNSVPKGNPASTLNKRALPRLSTKALRKKKLKKARPPSVPPPSIQQSLASEVVVETVHTNALVDVVWQDGTYEEEISSIELYPIHHLDDHEFFPGDFVIRSDSSDPRTYGVIQKMDHSERVAVVKWFEAYSYAGEQKPKELEEAEMSVFDIKDHPDFRFRPGTIVIRVANLAGQSCGAGQIMDNYPDGQVRVWWANSTMTACWPQDLFRLGEYDSDEGEIWDDNQANSDVYDGDEDDDVASDSSWVTETEEELNESQSGLGPDCVHRYLMIGKLIEKIQKTLVMTRESIVASGSVSIENENGVPNSPSVAKLVNNEQPSLTKKLLLIYKDCQYLDKMMGTKFFDVDDLKNWYRGKEGVSSKSRRMIEQISRMFDIPPATADGKAALRRLSSGSDYQLSLTSNMNPICPSSSQQSIGGVNGGSGTGTGVESKQAEAEQSSLPCPKTPKGEKDKEESVPNTIPDVELEDTPSTVSNPPTPNFLSYELCSIILNKLLKVHSEYQKRFGSGVIVSEELVLPGVGGGEEAENKKKSEDSTVPSSASGKQAVLIGIGTVVLSGSGGAEVPNKIASLKGLFSSLFKGNCVTVTHTGEQSGGVEAVQGDNTKDGGSGPEVTPVALATEPPPPTSTTSPQQSENQNQNLLDSQKENQCPVLSASGLNPSTSDSTSSPSNSNILGVEEDDTPKSQFIMIETVPDTHRYRLTSLQPQNQKNFVKAVQKEVSLMRGALPDGIFVKAFEDRMDLFSVMIRGPENTPYEDGIFFFDIQLPAAYPSGPPLVHYVSFCTDRLNPNLYEEGKVCVSLLGTWSGKGTEVWTSNSSILQVLVSIQGLILVPEPYYNEAGYEKQRGSQQGMENSRMYNEMVLIKLVQSMSRMLVNPPAPWEKEAVAHIQKFGPRMVERYKKWLLASENQALENQNKSQIQSNEAQAPAPGSLPEFPLLPVSKGFSITLKKTLDNFAKLCATTQPSNPNPTANAHSSTSSTVGDNSSSTTNSKESSSTPPPHTVP